MERKKYCNIHNFYYEKTFCPFCLKERSEAMYQKHKNSADDKNEQRHKDSEQITKDDLNRLINKFNKRQ